MSQQGNYIDDVPVKISEKYKPSPLTTVPHSISESIANAKHIIDSLDYDFSLETNILSKLEEIRFLRESQENERKHRLQLFSEEKQRKLDAIAAAEAEEKLKQLSVSEVSYPSTDDSSEISPDENADRDTDTNPISNITHNQMQSDLTITSPLESKENEFETPKSIYYPTQDNLFKSNNDQDENILKPTLISSCNYSPSNLLDDPDPIKGMQQNINVNKKYSILKMVNIKNNFENLTYSDFEHDTSSPFDNMELKTINDMEMLAQVLNIQQRGTDECKDNTLVASPATDSTNHVNYHDGYINYYDVNTSGVDFHPQSVHSSQFCNNPEPILNNTSIHHLPSNYNLSNGYLSTNAEPQNDHSNTLPNGYYDPMYNYYQNNYQNAHHANYAGSQNEVAYPTSGYFINKSENFVKDGGLAYLPKTSDTYSGYNYSYRNTNCSDYSVYIPPQDDTIQNSVDSVPNNETHSTVNSRSRSVPDIIRELDEEIMSARKRMKDRSYNASPAPTSTCQSIAIDSKLTPPVPSCSEQKSIKDNLHRPFQNLSNDLQNLCKYISGMGFPLERVARACQAVGSNDKKVVEYLLTMGELMDLGFNENQVASALIHNDFNRDKALDDLVS